MPVLKGSSAHRLTGDAIVLDLGDLKREADRIRAEARLQADRLLAEARAEADELVATADARGYAEGLARGTQEGITQGRAMGHQEASAARSAQIDEVIGFWRSVLGEWTSERSAMLDAARDDLLELAMRIAAKVIARIPEIDPSIVVDQVANAVELAGRGKVASIRVHPEALLQLRDAMPALEEAFAGASGAELVGDPQVELGGVIVRTAFGEVDARIETQLTRIAEELLPGGAA